MKQRTGASPAHNARGRATLVLVRLEGVEPGTDRVWLDTDHGRFAVVSDDALFTAAPHLGALVGCRVLFVLDDGEHVTTIQRPPT